ncbi:MAG: FAD-binding domain-containing protein [Pseudomonadota bacterium]
MNVITTDFPPTREAAEQRLAAFVPRAGRQYAQRRNFDLGPGRHDGVSSLSPYVRMRLLDEIGITRAVLQHHSAQDADKFITEVFWRTYWKGWMELRPSVWLMYRNDINCLSDDLKHDPALHADWTAACNGQTGIDPFDAWARELVETGYMHNHARMWFASIWVFTLNLPWQLGADFFLRHLLDGDAAVNTLSWRWVAGIQTQGKTYLATSENIAKFTNGRFANVRGLSPVAIPREAAPNPSAGMLPEARRLPLPERYGILLHSDDVDLEFIQQKAPRPSAVAFLDATAAQSPWSTSTHVTSFRTDAAKAACADLSQDPTLLSSAKDIAAWATKESLDQIVTPYAPVGQVQHCLDEFARRNDATPVSFLRRSLDEAAWPLATKGFFPFRKQIPKLIKQFLTR